MGTVTSLLEQEAGRLDEIAAAVKTGVAPSAYVSALSHIAGNLRAIAAAVDEAAPAAVDEAAPAAPLSPRMAALDGLLKGTA